MSEIIDYEERKTMLEKTVNSVMSGLKDFQQATVNRIDQLFREDKHKITRVLVSDEVGLGKTLIAKGTVAKMALLRHEEKDDLFRVVYVCSNATIADQNLKNYVLLQTLFWMIHIHQDCLCNILIFLNRRIVLMF